MPKTKKKKVYYTSRFPDERFADVLYGFEKAPRTLKAAHREAERIKASFISNKTTKYKILKVTIEEV